MTGTDRLLAFALLSLVLIVIPGPSVLFVVGRALALGRRAAVITVVGNAAGEYLAVVAVAVGIGVVVARSAVVFAIIKFAGAAYLVFLGVRAIVRRHRLAAVVTTAQPPQSSRRTLWEGFVVGLANPKSAVFFAAVLPQFVDRSAGHVPVQLLLLGAIFVAIALVCDGLWALAAGTARDWFARSPRRLAITGGTGGLTMIGLGIGLAFTGRTD